MQSRRHKIKLRRAEENIDPAALLPTFITRTTLRSILHELGVATLTELEKCSSADAHGMSIPLPRSEGE